MTDSAHTGLFAALLAAGVEFVVVGGVAVNLHGYRRATSDLDIFIRSTESNAQAAFRALESIGAPLQGWTYTDLLSDEDHLRFGVPEDHVDILNSIGPMHFDEAWSDHVEVEIDGLLVPYMSKSCLIKNKLQTGRHRDLVDVEELELLPDKY